MQNNQYPGSASKKSLRVRGKVRRNEEAIVTEKQLVVDEAGLLESEDTGLATCCSCDGTIHSQEEVGGLCECGGVLDKKCSEQYKCQVCSRVCCYDHSIHLGSFHYCSKHGWIELLRPIALALALILLVVLAVICGVPR